MALVESYSFFALKSEVYASTVFATCLNWITATHSGGHVDIAIPDKDFLSRYFVNQPRDENVSTKSRFGV